MKTYLLIAAIALFTACEAPETSTRNQNIALEQSHRQHDSHSSQVNERGDKAMGFSHQKTKHRFRLWVNGGAIEVTANDPGDAESRDQIRKHLGHIAQMFGDGNFDAPMLTHGKTPLGVPVLQNLKREVRYEYEEIEGGGRVRISTANQAALAAVHEFLRFQIEDHQTGDSTEIESGR
jgi:hypothetical protein